MVEVVKAFALGAMVGGVFALFRLAVPAPAAWAGLAGVVGLVVGWRMVSWGIARW